MNGNRIYRPAQFEKLIDYLTGDEGIFETKQAVMMFAAAVGWHFVRKRQPRGKAGESIRWDTFQGNNDDAFIHALALVDSESIEILGRDSDGQEDDPIKVFEEYATAGLQYIEDKCVKVPRDLSLLDNFLHLIAEVNTYSPEPPPDLEGLSSEALDFLAG